MKGCVRAQASSDLPEGWPEPQWGLRPPFSELSSRPQVELAEKFIPDLLPIKPADLPSFLKFRKELDRSLWYNLPCTSHT